MKMKKFLSLLASAVMMFSLVAMPVHADENTTSLVKTPEELIDKLKEGNTVELANDITINPASLSNAYGTTGLNQTNGGTLNGKGYTVEIIGASGTWDSGINTTGGTIKNITVTGPFRGIFVNHNNDHSEPVILENVTIDGTTYTISCDQGVYQTLTATNCTFNGWTSYAATLGKATFENCSFGSNGKYAYMKPYASTILKNCKFEEGFELNSKSINDGEITLINCYVGETPITATNITELLGEDAGNAIVPSLNGGYLSDDAAGLEKYSISFELVNLPAISKEVKVELYSNETLLVTKSLISEEVSLNCSFNTVGTDDTWDQEQSSWVASENFVPTHALLFIDGVEYSRGNVGFTKEEWYEFPGTEHFAVEMPAVEATCTEKGFTKGSKCSECGEILLKQDVIPALGHKETLVPAVAPTCDKTGLTEGTKCSVCNETIKAQEVVKALGHTYVEGECTECGAKDSSYVAPELPTVDTKEEVKEVTVGTDAETTKEVLNETSTTIVETIIAGEETTAVSEEVVKVIEEAVKNNDNLSVDTTVVVTPLDEEEVEEEHVEIIIETAGEEAVVAQYLDLQVLINVKVNGKTVEIKENEVTELPKAMTFTVAIPEELKEVEEGYTRTYFVIRVHEGKDGKLEKTKLPVTVNEDGTLSFSTNQFSTYALAYEDTLKVSTQTGDHAPVMMYATMTMMAAAALVVLKKKESLVK